MHDIQECGKVPSKVAAGKVAFSLWKKSYSPVSDNTQRHQMIVYANIN